MHKDAIRFSSLFQSSILLDYLNLFKNAQKLYEDRHSSCRWFDNFRQWTRKISDFSDRIKDPVIMNFEFRSKKYRLKSEQVKDIELLTSEESDNFKSVVIQRMMAAGKTLVLGTISVVMKALKRNDRLSILVPPSSLYQSNTTDMQNRTYHYFKKRGNSFSFPRLPLASNDDSNGKKLSSFLENVISIINHTMTSRNYLILSRITYNPSWILGKPLKGQSFYVKVNITLITLESWKNLRQFIKYSKRNLR